MRALPAGAFLAVALLGGCGSPPASTPPTHLAPVIGERVVVAPSGPVAAPPLRFQFPVRDAPGRYRLTVTDPSDRVVAHAEAIGSPLILAESVGRTFIAGERYAWRVEVVGPGGSPGGEVARATFVVRAPDPNPGQ